MENNIITFVEKLYNITNSESLKNILKRYNNTHSKSLDIKDSAIAISKEYVEGNTKLRIVTANQESDICFVSSKTKDSVSLKDLSDSIQEQDTAKVCMIALTLVPKDQVNIPDSLEIRNSGAVSMHIDKRNDQTYKAIAQILQ